MKVIPEWKKAWRMFTVQIGALAVLWVALPADTQTSILAAVGISPEVLPGILGGLVIIARLIAQPKVTQ